ncbi:CASP8 and FADD-like apoptosis regulator isoform X2 [Kryptolebias marmoratus]|uniref:CASP8 and FADD like apoptosis regulator n=1 Tax=Kryptolebias marmoratus TaxID=37003 RepID=A0A3Q3FS83_KRYMA|nr:CASP8 and FADD-like apoptosis regulator isoform X2 [Kryptolebias marmoratus]
MLSPSDQSHLRDINVVAESLSSSEQRKVAYLCGSLETDCSVEVVKQMLKSNVEDHGDAPLFLKALILRLGRYDILRKVYKVGRNDVEPRTYADVFPTFRVLMVNISEDLSRKDVQDIKFLVSNILPRDKMECCQTFLDVITELEKLDSVSPERVDVVKKCLLAISRVDLVKKLDAYKMSGETSAEPLSRQQSCRAAEVKQRQPQQHFAKVVVSLPVCREPSRGSLIEQYDFTSNPRGVCVIIDCVGRDGGMLENMFKELHFDVRLLQWLDSDGILQSLKGIFGQRDNRRYDGFVCCIISRGSANHLFGTDLCNTRLPIDSIRGLFTSDSCPALAGKPKLFFIQRYGDEEVLPCARAACRDENVEVDGWSRQLERSKIPSEADIFWSHCWTDERHLNHPQHRSVYLKTLTDGLHKAQRRRTSLVDVHTEMNGAIFEHNKRNPGATYHIDVKHTLRKNLYLE